MSDEQQEQQEEEQQQEQDEETFDRAYVEKLRQEAAEHRTRAKRADELQARLIDALIREGTDGVLEDPDDLRRHHDDAAFLDDDGMPDVEKVRTAARELASAKPHLARRRPAGDIGQGARPEPPSLMADFAKTLREVAG